MVHIKQIILKQTYQLENKNAENIKILPVLYNVEFINTIDQFNPIANKKSKHQKMMESVDNEFKLIVSKS